MTGLFAAVALDYLNAGWSPIPVWYPGGTKAPLVGRAGDGKQWIGRTGNRPTEADIQRWVKKYPRCRAVGLRLPDDIVGIDLDLYDGKVGQYTIAKLQRLWGKLGETVMSTARADGSCVRLYRLPLGVSSDNFTDPVLRDRDGVKVSGGVEVLRAQCRFLTVWPSVHPKVKTRYQWYWPDFTPFGDGTIPEASDVTELLPAGWCEGLAAGRTFEGERQRIQLAGDPGSWLRERPRGGGEPCAAMGRLLDRHRADIEAAGLLGGLHDATRIAIWQVVGNACEGCRGAYTAAVDLFDAFEGAMAERRNRRGSRAMGRRETLLEFKRLLIEAIEKQCAQHNLSNDDPCDLEGIKVGK